MRLIYFLKNIWYSFTMSFWALRTYFKVTTKMVPFDYSSVLHMMNFQINILANHIEKYGHEVDISRLEKVKNMKRFVELSNNQLKDNFAERVGYDFNYEIKFEETEETKNKKYELKLFEMNSTETPEQKEKNNKALKDATELEEKEWNEMIELLKDMRAWWD